LLAPWSFIQPAITYYFLYGDGILDALFFGIKKIETSFGIPEVYFFKAFLFILLAKMALSALVPFVSRKRSALVENIPPLSREPRGSISTWRGVARDLTRPLFLFSFVLFLVYLIFTESDKTEIVLKALRPLALGIVLFWISRSPWTGKVIARLREKPRFHRFFALTDLTLSRMSRTPESVPKPYRDPRS